MNVMELLIQLIIIVIIFVKYTCSATCVLLESLSTGRLLFRGVVPMLDIGERLARDLERLERFRMLDDTFMRQVFRGQLELAQHVLRIITGLDGLKLVKEETQHDLKRATGSKSPVLDVWGTDGAGTQYNMEVQKGSDLDPLRFRYYGSAMDVDALAADEDYSRLPERWVVVVLESDPDGPGRRRRHYRTCEEDGGTLEDGAHLLYANASWRGDDELGRLMADFCESDPDKIHDNMVRNRVQYLKRDPEGVREMCRISEEIFNEGVEQGIEQGIEQGARDKLIENVRSLMETLHLTAQQALDALKVPAAEQARYIAML